ncbi:MAG: HK97 gp10 family phage protein [Aquamicrobium sp.]|uniref:HK97-gp10 family putative phage morphogenesis protein n=1 Tax=Aquamicrobium sp. TaxID=1872579 RepID=UPI00349EA735|nr:HK97 gp10 family phage protein [Aquamicrobium sp.]
MSVRIRVKGVKGLGRAFRNATGMVSEKIDKAVEKNATEMVGTAKALVPENTGALKESIGKEKVTNGWKVEATDEAAPYVEFGTRKMDPQPFFFPAYRLNKKRFNGRVKRAAKAAIKEAGIGK